MPLRCIVSKAVRGGDRWKAEMYEPEYKIKKNNKNPVYMADKSRGLEQAKIEKNKKQLWKA